MNNLTGRYEHDRRPLDNVNEAADAIKADAIAAARLIQQAQEMVATATEFLTVGCLMVDEFRAGMLWQLAIKKLPTPKTKE